jgi:uncharacterized protein YndB with AHSA1/START domain
MRRLDIRTCMDIDRPAAEVFDFVADQTNAPRWQHGLHEVRRLTPGPIGVGTEHVFARRFAGMNIESRNRYTGYEPGRFVSFEIPAGKITGEASYRVEPTGPKSSRLISEVHFYVSGVTGLAAPLLARVFVRDSKKAEATLKELLENTDA